MLGPTGRHPAPKASDHASRTGGRNTALAAVACRERERDDGNGDGDSDRDGESDGHGDRHRDRNGDGDGDGEGDGEGDVMIVTPLIQNGF